MGGGVAVTVTVTVTVTSTQRVLSVTGDLTVGATAEFTGWQET